jgi:two-component system, chemotaxis family, chemotaxis protein CheY
MSAKRVGLVGHCSPDSSGLTIAVTSAVPGVKVVRVTDEAGVEKLLGEGVDLLLVNRAMEPGYSASLGTDYIRKLRASHPNVKLMLISNYPDAQAAAVADGALPGFGKSDLMSPRARELLSTALKD